MTGSVRVRPGKRWIAVAIRYDLGPDPATGERRQGSETVARLPLSSGKREVAAAEREAHQRLDALSRQGDPSGGRTLLRDYLPAWLELHAPSVAGATVRTYRSVIDTHLIPALGGTSLHDLSPLDIEGYIAALRAAGLSEGSVGLHKAILTAALSQAVRWGMIPASPMARVTRQRRRSRAVSREAVWDGDELRRFLSFVAGDPDEALWRVLALGGLRIGEALALKWDSVDLARGEVIVRRTLTQGERRPVTVAETTKGGRARVVGLDGGTVAALKRCAAVPRGTVAAALVFPGSGPTGIRSADAVRRRFRRLCAAAAVPAIRLHGLRHGHATALLAAGVPVKVVSDRLGHAASAMTLDVYGHVLGAMRGGAVEAIEGMLVNKSVPESDAAD